MARVLHLEGGSVFSSSQQWVCIHVTSWDTIKPIVARGNRKRLCAAADFPLHFVVNGALNHNFASCSERAAHGGEHSFCSTPSFVHGKEFNFVQEQALELSCVSGDLCNAAACDADVVHV